MTKQPITRTRAAVIRFSIPLALVFLGACSSSDGSSGTQNVLPAAEQDSLMDWATGTPGATSVYHSRDAACRTGHTGRSSCTTDERAGSAHVSGDPQADRSYIPGRGSHRPYSRYYRY